MIDNPHVTVVTACYNSRRFIQETIDAVLAQTYPNYELVLVDDGPKDPIKDIAESYQSAKINYMYKENGGPSHARNYAVERTQGDLIAFLDHDDVWAPTKLEDQINAMRRYDTVWSATGSQRKDHESGAVIEDHQYQDFHGNVFEKVLTDKYLWSFSSVLVTREIFEQMGMFNSNIWFMDDRDLYLRIGNVHPIIYLSKVLVMNKYFGGSVGSSMSMTRKLDIHETLVNNARRYRPELPQAVIDKSYQMVYRTGVIEFMRANDFPNMRKMLQKLDLDLTDLEILPYRLLSVLSDGTLERIINAYRKQRNK